METAPMAQVAAPVCVQVIVAVGADPALTLPAPSVSVEAAPELVCHSWVCPAAAVRVTAGAVATVSITTSPAALLTVTVGDDAFPLPVLEPKASNGVTWLTRAKSVEAATTPTVGAVTGIVMTMVLSPVGGAFNAQISTRDLAGLVLTLPTLKMPTAEPLSVMEVTVEVG